MNIGILNLQGAVSEHYNITKKAIKNMGIDADVKTVRYAEDVAKCNALNIHEKLNLVIKSITK